MAEALKWIGCRLGSTPNAMGPNPFNQSLPRSHFSASTVQSLKTSSHFSLVVFHSSRTPLIPSQTATCPLTFSLSLSLSLSLSKPKPAPKIRTAKSKFPFQFSPFGVTKIKNYYLKSRGRKKKEKKRRKQIIKSHLTVSQRQSVFFLR